MADSDHLKLPPAGNYEQLAVKEISAGTALYRISSIQFPTALHFATGSDGRWNADNGEYGVLYVGDSFDTAWIETFGRNARDREPPASAKFVGENELRERALFEITPSRVLRVAQLYGDGLVRLNLDARFCGKVDYSESQAWSRWVYAHNPVLDGLIYHSSLSPNRACLALFDRCRADIRERSLGPILELGDDLWDLMARLGWGLTPES